MTRPRLLDLFCGAGGAAVGYHRAGFDVTGVDNRPQSRYPFPFIQADAMTFPLGGYDAIHASPPCQDHSVTQNFTTARHGSGWMLAATRELLQQQPLPWVIENVPGSPMRADYKLCGCMFDGLRTDTMMLNRERWFETSWHGFGMRPPCSHDLPAVSVAGHDVPSHQRKFGRSVTLKERRQAMGIDWMGRDELGQAIPPAYTVYIGAQLMEHLKERAA
jgi:DNA (cytosine-5)-methyltransferase 1